jgi:DNA-binding transcriptional LysR family regulator
MARPHTSVMSLRRDRSAGHQALPVGSDELGIETDCISRAGNVSLHPTMQMTLRQLEVFRTMMRCRTVVDAARELRIAQPTVTKTVMRIEDVCGVPLFDRTRGRLIPTAEAHRLLHEVEDAFEQLEGAVGRALRAAQAEGGTLRIGASPSVGRVLVPLASASLLRSRPGLSLQIDILSVSQVIHYLTSGRGECAITLFPILHAGVRSAKVCRAGVFAIAPKDWIAAGDDLLNPARLSDKPLIVYEPQSVHGRALDAVLLIGGFRPPKTHVVRFAETAIGLAEAGIGVAVTDAFSALAADRAKVTVCQLDCPAPFEVFLHRQVEKAPGRLVEMFRKVLAERAAELGAEL